MIYKIPKEVLIMSLLDLLNKVKKEVEKKIDEITDSIGSDKPAADSQTEPAYSASAEEWSSDGDSWYDHVPAEENQYNSGLNYLQYFEKIFAEDFPDYDITREDAEPSRRYIYRFSRGGAEALVLELMSENSSVRKTRNECEAKGMPYLRFYFDHKGWWNTRSYVTERIRAKLTA